MAKMTAGRAVVESLVAQGVDTVFGIISIHTLHLYDALREAADAGRIRFVGARHEHALGCMADGYARVTGKPGVMLTSSGPGAADSMGALGESYHSSIPLLHITTEIESEWLGKGHGLTHEAKDQMGMLASVTGWQAVAPTVHDVPDLIADAFDHLRSEHPRPAVLAVPTDYLGAEADFEIAPARVRARRVPDAEALASAARLIAGAERPAILAGGGVTRSGAFAELREFAERHDIPVATADGGKGAFPEDHPLSLGTALGKRIWGENPVQAYLAACDVVIAVGTSLPFRSTRGVGLELPEALVHIDIDPQAFGRNYPARVGLAGDAQAVLRGLLDAPVEPRKASAEARDELAQLQRAARRSVETQFPNELRLWEGVRAAVGRDAIVVCDSTIPANSAQRCLPVYEPRTMHNPHGWVSIGYGFAASLGAKVGAPERQVLCVTGDGGFQYNVQELASAAQYGIAPVVLLFNDDAWGVLQRYQDQILDGRRFATRLENPDFAQLAAAYGVGHTLVRGVDELTAALERVGTPSRLHIIEVATPNGVAELA